MHFPTLRTLARRVAGQVVAAGGADVVAEIAALAPCDKPDGGEDGEDEGEKPVGTRPVQLHDRVLKSC